MRNRGHRGVTLIMVAGVLSILAAMATGFYVLMLMQTKSAGHYMDSVRAELMARAGVDYAVAQLRAQAFKKCEDPTNAWYGVDYLRGASKRISFPDSPLLHNGVDDDKDKEIDNPEEALLRPELQCSYSAARGNSANNPLDPANPLCPGIGNPQYQAPSDRFTLNVTDAAGKININAGDNLAVMLDSLCRVIGPPLVAANLDALQPRRWADVAKDDPAVQSMYANALNVNDLASNLDIYYALTDANNNPPPPPPARPGTPLRPIRGADGKAIFGDGYAIAGYRARNGAFRHLEEVKNALTYMERHGNGTPDDALEQLEIEVKFAAIRDYITISSWVDTNTVCVGKFEWVHVDTSGNPSKTYAIDRDKSWVIDDPAHDPLNLRGSLRGCYLSIMNGHGAGQLRRIRSNGIDWLEVENGFTVTPGPISSYMIIANEEAKLADVNNNPLKYSYVGNPPNPPPPGMLTFPLTNQADGTLVHDPNMDYSLHPLCIHRAPVNINTASDKVLAALLLGINVQHGHPMALGTDADVEALRTKWKYPDPHGVQPYLLKPAGLKRLPAASGKPVLDCLWSSITPPNGYDVSYLDNHGTLGRPNFIPMGSGPTNPPGALNDAHILAYRILMARQTDPLKANLKYIDANGSPTGDSRTGVLRGPFKSWDDLYFRVIKPWDDLRFKNGWVDKNSDGIVNAGDEVHKARLAPMLMANFNPNTDILKFNPNIEWIDRWGRNYTEQEALMIYTDQPEPHSANPKVSDPLNANSIPIFTTADTVHLKSSQRDAAGNFIAGAYLTRNYRGKSDELIDKTDLNRSTTEFSFDSNGIFEIISTGQVVRNGEALAERKFAALVKIYDVWRESTQQQFVQGTISKASGDFGSTCSGQLARDASAPVANPPRKGLVTLPEPLLPLGARILDQKGNANAKNKEIVTAGGQPLDAYGNNQRRNPYDPAASPIDVPDVLANHILPARYDGQIVLATNTAAFDSDPSGDADTFLATYDGDLDTATCLGNGREQAKTPRDAKFRVVDTIGLLGALNDTNVDFDPGLPLLPGGGLRWVYMFVGVDAALQPLQLGADLERPYYWNNVTVRMGDLRTDGVYLTGPGVAGSDATLKYLFGANKENFQPDSKDGNCITMWAKPVWHQDDFRHHEFFNSSNDGTWNVTRGCYIHKYGQYTWTLDDDNKGIGHSGNRTKINDLFCFWERDQQAGNSDDYDYGSAVHGGYAYVDAKAYPNESPGFRVQPFRWHFVGCRQNYRSGKTDGEGDGPRGHWLPQFGDYLNQKNMTVTQFHVRPFIDTQLNPEGVDANGQTTWKPNLFWCFRTTPIGNLTHCEIGDPGDPEKNTGGQSGQDVKWIWADPVGQANHEKCFGMNNLNYGNFPWQTPASNTNNVLWHYRHMPDDGTYAVIDELKISSKDRVLRDDGSADWTKDRVVREMLTSRYYLPPQPGTRVAPAAGGPPTFTSQTLLHSLKGVDVRQGAQNVAVVRVAWTVFTPRFMCEYKRADGRFQRKERLFFYDGKSQTQQQPVIPFKGPFDCVKYNDSSLDNLDWSSPTYSVYSVNRPPPWSYKAGQAQSGRGVEVELLKDTGGGSNPTVLGNQTFTDPTAINALGTVDKPVRVYSNQLRYRVRFRYPVDPLVDPGGGITDADGKPCVDLAKQYLLDTPVFDDISITYIVPTRTLDFREVTE